MTIHPIAIVEQVLEEYRSYLLTEFRARDEQLRLALNEAIERPLFLAQEPFFQVYRPFREGNRWAELGLDSRLAKVMEERSESDTAHLHQSEAIQHLLSDEATPLAVTTGTGSGKTECFLLPVIQNAIEDASAFKKPGLTSILIYPMNALANDQEDRIRQYLERTGHTSVEVARYDRATSETLRSKLRSKPPHILLTNYVMLEYLLVRPADRDALFKNHRCRFVVLDEVHTYRGSLGSNIALLYRRLLAHLRHAQHDFMADSRDDRRRFPSLVPVATSATIKSVDETGRSKEEVTRLRREAVQEFLHTLLGVERNTIRVIGEERAPVQIPADAQWPKVPPSADALRLHTTEDVRRATASLAGLGTETPLHGAAARARIFWTLGELLGQKPRSTSDIVQAIIERVPERARASVADVTREVEAALWCAAAASGIPGGLRLRVHRFIRGGWRFHRCVDPTCGHLYPMGEASCTCGKPTAPLLLCRACGADALHFTGGDGGVQDEVALDPRAPRGDEEQEWVLYDAHRHKIDSEEEEDEEDAGSGATRSRVGPQKLKGKYVEEGSFDPGMCRFSRDKDAFSMSVVLAPARNRCLVCGGSAGARSILTSVALGTSAALRVLAEGVTEELSRQHQAEHETKKERLLIFADSRQDAAHQARFITYAGRFDRLRRRLVRALSDAKRGLTISEVLRELLSRGFELHDNPHLEGTRVRSLSVLPRATQDRALAWEEAPLLDDLAVTASYRGTTINLGLVGVRYGKLDAFVEESGKAVAAALGLSSSQLLYLSRCLLDEMRTHGALSRPMLVYHPSNPNCPEEFRVHAEWERRLKKPQGYPCTAEGVPLGSLDAAEIPEGISLTNAWRRGTRGRPPRLHRVFEDLVGRMTGGRRTVVEADLISVLAFLGEADVFRPVKLFGFQKARTLLQVNADAIELELVTARDRRRCSICNVRMPWAPLGAPCRACHGVMETWPDEDVQSNRYVQRILSASLLPLHAGEHTAQVTGAERSELEDRFKDDSDPLNVLACSPTLEMGIDVGGLDAVLMRNVPPRPDNYAQRGGRAGRRSRIGVVVGYARSTPHDQYFYDKPVEMIAGEVAAPAVGLGNRDVVVRHLNAIALGSADPGLAGRMAEYITLKGELCAEPVETLIKSFEGCFEHAATLALEAWGSEILGPARLETKEQLLSVLREQPPRIRDLFDRVRRQIIDLQSRVKQWSELGVGKWNAMNAMALSRSILGLPADDRRRDAEADDRGSGHPMRRFAEFGILPGYEFPTEPATLRLLRDAHEEEPISVARRFGLAQYQPEAWAHARGHRWRVAGLDTSSPWNPKTEDPTWMYRVCGKCGLRFEAQQVRCNRCGSTQSGGELPGYDFGGFLAVRDDAPVLEEEDRFIRAANLKCYPQWAGDIIGRFDLPTRWKLVLYNEEEIRWVNEWRKPRTEAEHQWCLHGEARGFYLCPACGRILNPPTPDQGSEKKGRKAPRKSDGDPFGHASDCRLAGQPQRPLAITTRTKASTLRLMVTLPSAFKQADFERWGLTLGYALRTGLRRLYMLDGPEIEFVLEGPWEIHRDERKWKQASLTFIDPAVGGTGFLNRAAEELHLVAQRAVEHLDHSGCETACYRCLKSYENQRFHASLSWPHALVDLETLAAEPPRRLARRQGDVFDPGPWIEAYEAGVGSPLELKFLRLLEAKGLHVEKQFPISLDGGAPLTVADFAIPAERVAIYIDGAAFHQGENLRRDRYIRERLRNAPEPWTVYALTARDLATGLKPIAELLGEFPELPDPVPADPDDDGPDESAEPSQPEPPDSHELSSEPYEFLEKIDGGGMAECFKARERSSGDVVFVKRVQTGSADAAALARESDIYAKLQFISSDHLLQVRGLHRGEGFVSLITEFADGGDLKAFVDSRGKSAVTSREALPILLQIASGLAELHANQIVHRDLKPENVLRSGATWKLADFGIAKNKLQAAPGRTFQQAGTYGYAAPEQFEGVEAHPSADIYSFGKLVAFLLTGTTDPDKIRVEFSDWRRLAHRCAQYEPNSRPPIDDVLTVLRAMAGVSAPGSGPRLIDELYALCSSGREQQAVERVLAFLEADLSAQRLRVVDEFLKQVDVARLSPAVLIAALSITFPVKETSNERAAFLVRVEEMLRTTLGPERANALLASRR